MRSLEEHLSPHELASLPGSPDGLRTGLAGQLPDEQRMAEHLYRCEECSRLAEAHWILRGFEGTGGSEAEREDCPKEAIWLEFAAGLRPDQRENLLAHAAKCGPCATELKRAIELMQPDQHNDRPSDTMEHMDGLASATDAWQRRVAAQMAAAAPLGPPRSVLPFPVVASRPPRWIAYPVAAALVLGAVLGGLALWHVVHPSEAQLLAAAYNKQRTLALRIPGAEPVPLATGTRGVGDGNIHGLSDPIELTELKLRAQKKLDQTPNSAYWNQIMGEVQLQQLDGSKAKTSLQTAQVNDESLPHLQMDLAAAYFETASLPGHAGDYRDAANLYGKELRSKEVREHPDEAAMIHYNLALCWEGTTKDNDEALKELRLALSLERSDAWRKAIQAEIDRLSSGSAMAPTDGFEASLDEAMAKLLPLWSSSTAARDRITETAKLGLRHRDRWLLDWAHTVHTLASAEADGHLGAALAAGKSDDAKRALSEAGLAKAAYLGQQNRAGVLEAEAVETFALQRLGLSEQCVASAQRVVNDAGSAPYARLRARTMQDLASCTARLGDFTAARTIFRQASLLGADASLPSTQSLALTGLAETLEYIGLASASWQADVSVLDGCASSPCSPALMYDTLYNMARCAEQLREPYIAAEIMRSAEQFAKSTGVPVTDAYAIEKLASIEAEAGDFAASEQDFRNAFGMRREAIAADKKKADGGDLTIALWQTDEAEVKLRQRDLQGAMSLLDRSAPAVLGHSYLEGHVNYYTELASVQLSMGHRDAALQNANSAVAAAESSLHTLRSDSERNEWARRNADVYACLALVYLKRGDEGAALLAWERFRAAPYTTGDAEKPSLAFLTRRAVAPVLVIARLKDVYHGWLVARGSDAVVQSADLGERDRIERLANNFYRLCSDKDSSAGDIRTAGAQLYGALLRPFERGLTGADRLGLDLDASLTMLPVAAVPMPDGSWLGDSAQLSVLPGWWSIRDGAGVEETRIGRDDRLTVVDGFPDAAAQSSEAGEIVRRFRNHRVIGAERWAADSLLQEMASAEIFHFTGHAGSDSVPKLLIGSGGGAGALNLTAERVRSIRFRSCKLAVLAACNTTAADPDLIEKLPDLRTAFLAAGARSVLASNWDVDDRSTHALMAAFYARLSAGDPPSAALKSAQRSVRSRDGWQHPFYWAPFEVFTN